MTRPLILITNDDGLESPGIEALAVALEVDFDVVVVAPEREQSAVSHKITLHKPMRVAEVRPARFACSGTPTDCVKVALAALLDRDPAIIVSGINRGPNLGDDTVYSGTVGGAREGTLSGFRSIAFSMAQHHGPYLYEGAAKVAATICGQVIERTRELPDNVLLNVNFPEGVDGSTPVVAAKLGARTYTVDVSRSEDPRGRPYYWIGGEFMVVAAIPGTDVHAVQNGCVSLTPIPVRVTDASALEAVGSWPGVTPATD